MAGFDIEWFNADDTGLVGEPAESESRIESEPSRLAIGLAMVLGLVVAWSVGGQLITNMRQTAQPAPIFDLQSNLERPPQADIPDFVEAAFGMPAAIIVATRHDGGPPLRVTISGGQMSADDLPQLAEFAVDASGQWLAAVSRNSTTDDQILWVGPMSGRIDPVAIGTQGFAWHDTTPGLLAAVFTSSDNEPGLGTIQYGSTLVSASSIGPADGWLQSWGDWGFVVSESQAGGRFDVLSPSGSLTVRNAEGTVAGYIGSMGLIVSRSDSSSPPKALDPVTGKMTEIVALQRFGQVWSANASTAGNMAILASNLDDQLHSLLILGPDAKLLAEIPAAGGAAPLWWNAEGSRLVFVSDHPEVGTQLIVYSATTDVIGRYPISYLDPFKHWSRAVSLS